jgi:hypothetical protein
MGDPPLGQEVVVTLAEGGSCLAYWRDGQWWVGVEDDPLDALLEEEVTGWAWRTD